MPRRALLVLLAVVALLATARLAGAYDSATWYEGADGWARARRLQREEKVPIFVYFRAEWCPHCHRLDEILQDRQLASRLRKVIKVRIDPEDGDEEADIFHEDFGAHGFPSLYLVSTTGAQRAIAYGPAEQLLAQLP